MKGANKPWQRCKLRQILKGTIWFELGVNSHCQSVRVSGESAGKMKSSVEKRFVLGGENYLKCKGCGSQQQKALPSCSLFILQN